MSSEGESTLGFGQKIGQIMQMAYVVEDMETAIQWWLRDCAVGPWFLLESFSGAEQRYRGEPSRADVRLAMSFAGHMNIELIQPRTNILPFSERPSIAAATASTMWESPFAMLNRSEPGTWRGDTRLPLRLRYPAGARCAI